MSDNPRHPLQLTDEVFRTLVNATSDFVGVSDLDGRLVYLNPAGRQLLGVGLTEDLAGRRLPDFAPAWVNDIVLNQGLPTAIQTGLWQSETALLHTAGHEIPVSQTILAQREGGEVKYLATFARDITQRKEAAAESALLYTVSDKLTRANLPLDLLEAISLYPRQLGATRGQLFYFDNNAQGRPEWAELVAEWPARPNGPRQYLPDLALAALWLAQAERATFITDVATHPAVDPGLRAGLTEKGMHTLAHLPLTVKGRWVGLVVLSWATPHEFNERDQRILTGFMQQLAAAVDAARSFQQAQGALAQTQQQLQAILDNVPVGIFIADAKTGAAQVVNRASVALLGAGIDPHRDPHTAAEMYPAYLPGTNRLYPAQDLPLVRTMTTGHIARGEVELHTPQGHIVAEVVTAPVLDARQQMTSVVALYRDITDRQRMEENLREREDELTALLEASPDAIGVVNTHTGLFERVNAGAERLYGLPRAELVQVGPAQMSPELQPNGRASGEMVLEKMSEALHGGRPVFEWTHRNVQGQRISCEIRLVGLTGARQHLVRFSVTDITERQRMVDALRESEQTFRDSIEAAGAVSYRRDHGARTYSYMGRGIYDLLGYQPEEMTTDLFESLVQESIMLGEGAGMTMTEASEHARSGQLRKWRSDIRLHTRNGQDRWVTDASVEVRNEAGETTGSVGILLDITNRKQAEAALRESEQRLQRDVAERKEIERTLAKRAAELEAVAEVTTAAATLLDPDELLLQVVSLAKERFNLYHAHIYLLNDTGETLVLTAGAGVVGRQMVSEGRTIPVNREQSLVARAARTRRPVIVNDVRADAGFLPHPLLPDTQAEMAIPIISGDRLLGVFDVQADEKNYFTDETARIQSILAAQVAVTLQNARQFSTARQVLDRESLVNSITQKIQSAATVESALQITARELGRALNARRTVVQLGTTAKASEPNPPAQA